jgi:hypothetical protein
MAIIDWREPMIARAEEMTQEVDGVTDPRLRYAILWHLSARDYGRIQRLEACYQCLATFPARPCKANMKLWQEAERAGWRHVRPTAVAHRLIREERCPCCGAPINRDALGLSDMGENPLNNRSDDA